MDKIIVPARRPARKSIKRHSTIWKKGPLHISFGDGKLDSFAPLVSVLMAKDAIFIKDPSCKIFDYYCLLAINRAPRAKYGDGPHFLLIKPRTELNGQNLFKVANAGMILTPTAIVGEANYSHNSDISKKSKVFCHIPKKTPARQGTIIGIAIYNSEDQKYFVTLNTEQIKLRIVPPMKIQSLVRLCKKLSGGYVDSLVHEERSIVFFQTIMAGRKFVQVKAKLLNCSLAIPTLTLNQLTNFATIK